jgi:hypothetical protein
MSQYIYRIQTRQGQHLVAVAGDYMMTVIRQAMADDGVVAEDHWVVRGNEIATVTREEVPA